MEISLNKQITRSQSSFEDNEGLARRFVNGDDSARLEMLKVNLKLVHHWANKFVERGLPFDDLVQEGIFGLDRAIRKFDPTRGFKFSTYASWWIRQSIQRAIVSKARAIKIPDHVLRAEFDAERDGEVIALAPRVTASLDAEISSSIDGYFTLQDVIPEDGVSVEDGVEEGVLYEELNRVVDRLSHLHADVVRNLYGLNGSPGLSRAATAKVLHISVPRVRRIEREAITLIKGQVFTFAEAG